MADQNHNHTTAPSMLPATVDNLVFAVSGKRLIDGLDASIPGGTITAIMGPNGAGKSLFLRLLHGMLQPTSGSVLWGHRRLNRDERRRQAMVFQKPVLLRRSCAANVDFVLRANADQRDQVRHSVLNRVGLEQHADTPARMLSGGEQQRLAIARALACAPEVLFLDEPTANLDPSSTRLIERIVTEVHRDGIKVIWVTHDIGQARRVAGDVMFLNKGRLSEHTTAKSFFDTPRSIPARQYLSGDIVD